MINALKVSDTVQSEKVTKSVKKLPAAKSLPRRWFPKENTKRRELLLIEKCQGSLWIVVQETPHIKTNV